MNTLRKNDLQDFRDFVSEKLNNGSAHLSPEEALDEWRGLHPDSEEQDDDLSAIQAALDDLDNGEIGVSLEELDREIRLKFNFPDQPTS